MNSSREKVVIGLSPGSPESAISCFAAFLSSLIFRLSLLMGLTPFEDTEVFFGVWGFAT